MAKKNLKNKKIRQSKTSKSKSSRPGSSSKSKRSPSKSTNKNHFYVIGIGASAGGLEALTELFKNVPSDTGMAFVIVQHMDPTHDSMLKSILSRLTNNPIHQVTHLMPLKADRIYVIPPNKNMAIVNNRFRLVPRSETKGAHLTVNYFLSSLAKEKKERAVGVILSGSASDGAIGQKEIKARGGITFSQDIESAQYQGMPQSAIDSGAIDYIMTPKAIAKELIKLSRNLPMQRMKALSVQEALSQVKGDMAKIFFLLKHFTGVDFGCYKKTTVERRIQKRMAATHKNTIKDYVAYLRKHPVEVEALFNDLLINVTSFFRDKTVYQALKKKVLPVLLKHKKSESSLRVWVPACSTGEEVYSLAIYTLESLGRKAGNFSLQFFGTDVNEKVINKARRGLFPESIKSQMPLAVLRRYFTEEEGGFRIIKTVRDICIFAKQDLTRDPPFSKLDLVSCRNLLIYMESPLQKKVIPLLHYSLNPSGFLILGTAETIGPYKELFTVIDKKHKIYAKKEAANRNLFYFSPASANDFQKKGSKSPLKSNVESAVLMDPATENLQAKDEELRSAFEEIQSANEELQSTNEELETSKEELQSTNEELTTLNDELASRNTELTQLSSDIQNLLNSTRTPVIMVGRDLRIRRFTPLAKNVWSLIDTDIGRPLTDINPKFTLSNLEGMLIDAIDHLKTGRAEVADSKGCWYELSVFPYKTIENMIDGAVVTLNDISVLKKSQQKIEVSKEYFENIVEAVPLPILVLDKNLFVRSANAAFYKQFKATKSQTQNRHISKLGDSQWNIPSLIRQFENVTFKNQTFDNFEVCHTFEHLGQRTILLNGRIIKENISGESLLLVSITDITEQKRLEETKKGLIRDVSHGIKTPISMTEMAINIGKDAVKERNLEKIKHAQNIAQNNIKKVRKDIDLILSSFSADLRKRDISKKKKRAVSLKVVFNQTVRNNELLIAEKSLKIKINIGPGAEKVFVDQKDLGVLVGNILDNATKFTDKGGRITLSSRLIKKWVVIRVRDNGCGILEKDKTKMFERFYRQRAAVEGTGLGLSICKEIVEMYGGQISIESKGEGKGATVIVKLPRK